MDFKSVIKFGNFLLIEFFILGIVVVFLLVNCVKVLLKLFFWILNILFEVFFKKFSKKLL